MAGFKIDAIRGRRPRISARKLPPGEAQIAINAKLGSGDLKPWGGPRADAALDGTAIETIYRFDNSGTPVWFEWADSDISVARGAVRDDALERTYYTGDGFPKMTYNTIAATGAAPFPNDFRRLGLPPPAAAPNVIAPALAATTVGNTDTITDGMTADRFFLTVLLNVFDTTTLFTPPYDERVYVQSDNADPLIGNPIDVGIGIGDTYVVTVIDNDTFSISNPTSEHLSKSPIPTSPRDGSTSESTLFFSDNVGGGVNIAGFLHAPNGLEITKVAHGLNNNSEILVTSVGVPIRYRYNSPFTDNPAGGTATAYNYFNLDYPATGPYPTGPDNTEISTHECTYDSAGNFFDLFGTWTFEVISDGDGSGIVVEERAYLYTYVTALGEEGPPSSASAFVNIVDGTSVTLDTFSVAPTTNYDITNIRLYRTNSTEEGADFQFIAEILDTDLSYIDLILNSGLGEILPSIDWDRPDPDMQGIISMPNGMMMGFKDRTVYFAEPYFPHAWPAIYDQAVDFDIVGLSSIGNSAVIVTTGTPYIVSGAHPRNASIRPYKINQACSSKRSIVSLADRVVYASPDGLIQIGIDGASNVSEKYFTKDEWQALFPDTMVAAVHDGRYIAFFDEVLSVNSAVGDTTFLLTGETGTVGSETINPEIGPAMDWVLDSGSQPSEVDGEVSSAQANIGTKSLYWKDVTGGPDAGWQTQAGTTMGDFTGDFTIEFDLFIVNWASPVICLAKWDFPNRQWNMDISDNGGDGEVAFAVSSSGSNNMNIFNQIKFPTEVISLNEWNNFSVSRAGNNWYLFCNGELSNAGVVVDAVVINIPASAQFFVIGQIGADDGSGNVEAYMSNVRITEGVALYTTAYTPTTELFPAPLLGHIVFSPDDASIGFTTGDTIAMGAYLDIEDDALYYTDGSDVFEWDSDTDNPLSIQWKSSIYLMRAPVNIGAGVVEAETYPVTFLLYGNDVLRATVVVPNNEPFRLPGGYLASRYEVEITGTSVVNEVKVAESILELAEG